MCSRDLFQPRNGLFTSFAGVLIYTDGIVSQTDVSEAAYVIDENEVNRFSDNIISGAPLDDG